MDNTPWILVDTQTTAATPPMSVMALAAQRMLGWVPEGAPFVRLLNHAVEISPAVSQVHGDTREKLAREGEPPLAVYAAFFEYAEARPLVAYPLSKTLDQILTPEWQRLGCAPVIHRGFCALRLAQRLLDPPPTGHDTLQTLCAHYQLPSHEGHPALGNIFTLIALLQQVLRPQAEAHGLSSFAALSAYTTAPWFPARIAFGPHQGRDFREAHQDAHLRAWLESLANAKTPQTACVGRWYLEQLEVSPPLTVTGHAGLARYRDPERAQLAQQIESARACLAELETELAHEHQAVNVVQARLFAHLRPLYQRRQTLHIIISYRQRYLDLLLHEGEASAEQATADYAQRRAETEREYQEAAAQAQVQKTLSAEENEEVKALFRQLVRLYHPDRYAHDPQRQAIYARLMQAINQARDQGNIAQLREIAADPNAFLMRQGLESLDFSDDTDLNRLRQLYASLQQRIEEIREALDQLRASEDYELHRLTQQRPELLEEIAAAHKESLDTEIQTLEQQAAELAEEITTLTGRTDCLRE